MDGRKALLRKMLIASLACTSLANGLAADDFIRPPSKPRLTAPRPDQAIRQPATTPVIQPTPSSGSPTTPPVAAPIPSATDNQALAAPKATPFASEPKPAVTIVPAPSGTVNPVTMNPVPVNPSPVNPPMSVPESNRLELDAPEVPSQVTRGLPEKSPGESVPSRVPANFAARSTGNPLPAKTVSTSASNSLPQLNWQPRGSTTVVPHSRAANMAGQGPASIENAPSIFDAPVPAAQPKRTSDVRLEAEPIEYPAPIDQDKQARQQLAERISKQLTAVPVSTGTSPAPLEPGAGWQALGEELKAHVARCDELLSRRAYRSAMEEASDGILRLARALDLRENRPISEPAWAAAQQSFREALDFTRIERLANDSQLLAQLIQSHETEVLRGANVGELTPLAAAQHYRAHAETCLVAAAQGHPWFSELYYCMGRAMQAQAETARHKADVLTLEALSYFRAAQAIDPSNATNSNQLAFVLLRLDRPNEAMSQLQQVITLPGCPLEAWQNLVQASSRLGDKQTEKWAVDQYMTLKMQGVEPSGPVNTLLQVSPEQFMAMSPRTVGPMMPASGGPVGPAPTMQTPPPPPGMQTSPPARTANSSIFGIFR